MYTYATVCSGVEGCTLALDAMKPTKGNWKPIFYSEIAPFPSAVLAHHYPEVPNLGDMSKISYNKEEGIISNGTTNIEFNGRLDMLAGGTPCQDFSVAGKRQGGSKESGTRSSLCWEWLRLASELNPRILLWENVVGTFSSNGGRDFYEFVCAINDIGYCVSWKVLDAQYTRVDAWPMAIPQRRRRVWLVASADTDIESSSKILFEPKGLLGSDCPRRETWENFTTTFETSPTGTGGSGIEGISFDANFGFPTIDECAHTIKNGTAPGYLNGVFKRISSGDMGPLNDCCNTILKCSEDGIDNHTNVVMGTSKLGEPLKDNCANTILATEFKQPTSVAQNGEVIATINGHTLGRKPENGGHSLGYNGDKETMLTLTASDVHAVVAKEVELYPRNGDDEASDVAHTLDSHSNRSAITSPVVLNREGMGGIADAVNTIDCSLGRVCSTQQPVIVGSDLYNQEESGDVAVTITSVTGKSATQSGPSCIGFDASSSMQGRSVCGINEDGAVTITSEAKHVAAAPFTFDRVQITCPTNASQPKPNAPCFTLAAGSQMHVAKTGMYVRRLMPEECEVLMGYPIGYTRIPYRGKPADQCPDSPRYEACGNGWAINCARWVLLGIHKHLKHLDSRV